MNARFNYRSIRIALAMAAGSIFFSYATFTFSQTMSPSTSNAISYANAFDQLLASEFEKREADWRNGAIVYQVLVDRFEPATDLDAKKHLYPAPKKLRSWNEVAKRGEYLPQANLWSHEIDFWGGDLRSMRKRLGHVQSLGADVLYLNPIHLGYTNHKYDALDYLAVSPEYGVREDVKALAADVHARGMKLVLDGVFNHVGRNSAQFQDASKSERSRWRNWFYFGAQYPTGARAWSGAENLLELNLENPEVRAHIYGDVNSVIRSYLRDGVDGWRLDTAFELGAPYLKELTAAAHAEKPGSLVVGEVPQYPKEWFPAMDAVMNFTLREIIFGLVNEKIAPATALRMVDRMTAETGIEAMLKSWTLLDNHDVPRLATVFPKQAQQRFAQALLFTLPGAPNVYYGSEVAMEGGDDPEMRSPMRWDLVKEDNAALRYTRQLIALRKKNRALKIGNIRSIESTRLFAFERYTDRVQDTILVLANPSDETISETVMVANSKLTNGGEFEVLLHTPDGAKPELTIYSGLIKLSVPPQSVIVLKPILERSGGYSPYKRTQ